MKHILPIILILLLALAFVSCHHGERQTLRSALQMAYADPDSALTMLHTIDRRALPPAEKAYYALTYYLAQNKSGLDVANDSLIRVAYNYYAKLPEDSLYARCMYYMGVYYSLSDSLERASYCLKEAAQAAKVQKDTATLCLIWCKNSWVARKSNAPLGLKYACQALTLYRKYSQATPLNTIYYILLKGESKRFAAKAKRLSMVARRQNDWLSRWATPPHCLTSIMIWAILPQVLTKQRRSIMPVWLATTPPYPT